MEIEAGSPAISRAGTAGTILKNLWQSLSSTIKTRKPRRLRVRETLSLGERRFLAVIEFDRQEFLVGGTGNSLELLARLQDGKVVTKLAPSFDLIEGR